MISKERTTEARGEVKCNLLTTATNSIRLFINPSYRCRGTVCFSLFLAFRLGWSRLEGIRVVNYSNKRAMIQQILERNGYFDWYIAQPDTQHPDSRNPRCILINFAEKKKAELVIPYEWFQRYHRIAKLIALAVQHPSPRSSLHW